MQWGRSRPPFLSLFYNPTQVQARGRVGKEEKQDRRSVSRGIAAGMRLDEETLGPVSVLAEPPLQKVVAPAGRGASGRAGDGRVRSVRSGDQSQRLVTLIVRGPVR